MVLLAIAIAVGVGLIVHFAGGSREIVCNCSSGGGPVDPAFLRAECKKIASKGDKEICKFLTCIFFP